MKICLVSDTLPGYHQTWSGAELVCARLGEVLKKEGHQVVFITTPSKKINTQEETFQLPLFLDRFSKFIPFFPSFSTNFPCDIYSIFRSILMLRKIRPDIIHFHTKKLFLPIMVAALFFKIPTVFTVVDYFLICPRNILLKPNAKICTKFHGVNCADCISISKHPIKRKLQRAIPTSIKKLFSLLRFKIFDYLIKKLDLIVTFTDTSKQRLINAGLSGEKIKVIYQYQIDFKETKIKNLTFTSKNPIILFVGALHEHKGLHILIQAMASVVSKIPKAKLIIVGTGSKVYKTKIENLIQKLKLKENIEFLGQRKNEEVLEMISKSDVIAVPEQWLSDFGPVILLEAMALGKPVVGSKIGSIPEFIKDGLNGFLVEYNKPQQFAKKIIWLLKNKRKAESMGERAKESTQFLLSGDHIKKLSQLYSDIISLK